jgi:hypothetical protein
MMKPRSNPSQAAPEAMNAPMATITVWNRTAIGFRAVHPMKSGHAA